MQRRSCHFLAARPIGSAGPSRAKSASPAEREFRRWSFRSAPPFMANRPRIMAALSLGRRGRVRRGLVRHCAARLAQKPRSFSAGVFASLDLRWKPNRLYTDFSQVKPGAVEEGRSYGGPMVRIQLPPSVRSATNRRGLIGAFRFGDRGGRGTRVTSAASMSCRKAG